MPIWVNRKKKYIYNGICRFGCKFKILFICSISERKAFICSISERNSKGN